MKITFKTFILITLFTSLFLGFVSCELEDEINEEIEETIDTEEEEEEEESEPEVILSTENAITSISVLLNDVQYNAEIDHLNNSVLLTLPSGTNLSEILPIITIPDFATISPDPSSVQNYEEGVLFTITAEDGTTQEYEVKIIAPSNENSIISSTMENELMEPITGFIDEDSKSILFEVPNTLDLTAVKINITIPEDAVASLETENIIDLSSTTTLNITAENGDISEYSVSTYTTNLLTNPTGDNNGFGWDFDTNTGIETTAEYGNIFYITAYEGDFSPHIYQTVTFPRDYSEKYVLFIGNLTTEKVLENSITRHSYLWAYQTGEFSQDDWIYMQGMAHTAGANEWEVVSGSHKLLPNVTGTYFQLGQGRRNGDPYDGTTCKFRDLEVRLFESAEDAAIYVSQLYNQ